VGGRGVRNSSTAAGTSRSFQVATHPMTGREHGRDRSVGSKPGQARGTARRDGNLNQRILLSFVATYLTAPRAGRQFANYSPRWSSCWRAWLVSAFSSPLLSLSWLGRTEIRVRGGVPSAPSGGPSACPSPHPLRGGSRTDGNSCPAPPVLVSDKCCEFQSADPAVLCASQGAW